MPSAADVVSFQETPPPVGESPWAAGAGPDVDLVLQPHDEAWLESYAVLAARVRGALGLRVLSLDHVGSTAVPGVLAKPIIDLDLIVADPDDEKSYVAALVHAGFVLRIREPWWYRHRMFRSREPVANLHVFGLDSPEPVRHRIFRDYLRSNAQDRELYPRTKCEAAKASKRLREDVMQYNDRKRETIREIYGRAFVAAGLLED